MHFFAGSEEEPFMNEKPIERLNYYNGQRLEARDLKLEQEYHIRTRRWLNKSLYTAGIARGLTARYGEEKSENGPTPVAIVSPGLALDFLGREIILVEEKSIQIPCGTKKYLTIRYAEETTNEEQKTCAIRSNPSDKPPWGGPARILADPALEFLDYKLGYPAESSGRVVLCLMDDSMHARVFDNSVRLYVIAAGTATVHQYAIEGERHIDKDNPGRIHFHIRGRQPNAVTLYLKAEQFSTLFYSEMGKHDHNLVGDGNVKSIGAPDHVANSTFYGHCHTLDSENVIREEEYKDDVRVNLDKIKSVKDVNDKDLSPNGLGDLTHGLGHTHMFAAGFYNADKSGWPHTFWVGKSTPFADMVTSSKWDHDYSQSVTGGCIYGGQHTHKLDLNDTGPTKPTGKTDPHPLEHTHPSVNIALGEAGVLDQSVRSVKVDGKEKAEALTYLKNLSINIVKVDTARSVAPSSAAADRQPLTIPILMQIADANPDEAAFWPYDQSDYGLGDGKEGHPFVTYGTGPIRLDLLPYPFDEEGEYIIELSVKDKDNTGNGGRILYNLYVE
jgi:hypothetical protein